MFFMHKHSPGPKEDIQIKGEDFFSYFFFFQNMFCIKKASKIV